MLLILQPYLAARAAVGAGSLPAQGRFTVLGLRAINQPIKCMSATNALLARLNLPLQVLIPIGTVVVLSKSQKSFQIAHFKRQT